VRAKKIHKFLSSLCTSNLCIYLLSPKFAMWTPLIDGDPEFTRGGEKKIKLKI